VKELEYTPAQARTKKAKYAGRPKELIEWLEGEVANKRNDGSKREEPKKEDPKPEQKATHRESAEAEPQQDAKQPSTAEHEKPVEAKKSNPPASDSFNNW